MSRMAILGRSTSRRLWNKDKVKRDESVLRCESHGGEAVAVTLTRYGVPCGPRRNFMPSHLQ